MRHEAAGLFHLSKRVATALSAQACPARGGFRRALDRAALTLVTATAKLFNAGAVTRRLRFVEALLDATSTANAIVGYMADDLVAPEAREALLELTRQLAAELELRRHRLRALVGTASAQDEIEEPLELDDAVVVAATPVVEPASEAVAAPAAAAKEQPSRAGGARRHGPKTTQVPAPIGAVAGKNGHPTKREADTRS
jgi:hypothetical protein